MPGKRHDFSKHEDLQKDKTMLQKAYVDRDKELDGLWRPWTLLCDLETWWSAGCGEIGSETEHS